MLNLATLGRPLPFSAPSKVSPFLYMVSPCLSWTQSCCLHRQLKQVTERDPFSSKAWDILCAGMDTRGKVMPLGNFMQKGALPHSLGLVGGPMGKTSFCNPPLLHTVPTLPLVLSLTFQGWCLCKLSPPGLATTPHRALKPGSSLLEVPLGLPRPLWGWLSSEVGRRSSLPPCLPLSTSHSCLRFSPVKDLRPTLLPTGGLLPSKDPEWRECALQLA